jgi:hypothetical protein
VNQVRSVILFVKSVTKITFIREYGNINRFTYDYGHSFFLVNVVVPTVIT